MTIADHPLHRSGRADVPHPALALGDDAKSPQGIGMTDASRRQPAVEEPPHPVPADATVLTTARQRAMPEPPDLEPKQVQRRAVHRHTGVADMPPNNRAQPRAHCRNRVVHASSEFGLYRAQLRLQSLANRLPYHREASVASLLRADMREAEEVERLRLPFAASAPVVDRIWTAFQADAFSRDAIPDGTSERARSALPRIVRRPI